MEMSEVSKMTEATIRTTLEAIKIIAEKSDNKADFLKQIERLQEQVQGNKKPQT